MKFLFFPTILVIALVLPLLSAHLDEQHQFSFETIDDLGNSSLGKKDEILRLLPATTKKIRIVTRKDTDELWVTWQINDLTDKAVFDTSLCQEEKLKDIQPTSTRAPFWWPVFLIQGQDGSTDWSRIDMRYFQCAANGHLFISSESNGPNYYWSR